MNIPISNKFPSWLTRNTSDEDEETHSNCSSLSSRASSHVSSDPSESLLFPIDIDGTITQSVRRAEGLAAFVDRETLIRSSTSSSFPAMDQTSTTGFTNLVHGSRDLVLAAKYNFNGSRLATVSSDHKIRVFDLVEDGSWKLIEAWRGHNAEVLGVQWIGPSLGQAFGTIGGDNLFNVWEEQTSQAHMSGRRFRCIFQQASHNNSLYVSLDFITIKHEVWLALAAKDGRLSLLEPTEPCSLGSWKEIDSLYPGGQHPRGQEPNFNVCFHHSDRPCYKAVIAGLDKKAVSLAFSFSNIIKIFRATKPDDGTYELHEVAEIAVDQGRIRDIDWAPVSVQPSDLIAAACDDDHVRVFEVTTPNSANISSPSNSANIPPTAAMTRAHSLASRNVPSGIGAGLAGASRATAAGRITVGNVRIKHEWNVAASLPHSGVWKVAWFKDGSAFASTGDDGILRVWKKDMTGSFIEFAELGAT